MSLGNTDLLTALKGSLAYNGARQKILATNIANNDTPNYKAKDLKALNFKKLLTSQSDFTLSRTSASHFSGGSKSLGGQSLRPIIERDPYDSTPDGNKVNLEQQLTKMNQVTSNYTLATNLIRKYKSLHSLALSGHSS